MIQYCVQRCLTGYRSRGVRFAFGLTTKATLPEFHVSPNVHPAKEAIRLLQAHPQVRDVPAKGTFVDRNLTWMYSNGSSYVQVAEVGCEDLYQLHAGLCVIAQMVAFEAGDRPRIISITFGKLTVQEVNVYRVVQTLADRFILAKVSLSYREGFGYVVDDIHVGVSQEIRRAA